MACTYYLNASDGGCFAFDLSAMALAAPATPFALPGGEYVVGPPCADFPAAQAFAGCGKGAAAAFQVYGPEHECIALGKAALGWASPLNATASGSGGVLVTLGGGDALRGAPRAVAFALHCDAGAAEDAAPDAKVTESNPGGHYQLTWRHPAACPTKSSAACPYVPSPAPPPPPPPPSPSTAWPPSGLDCAMRVLAYSTAAQLLPPPANNSSSASSASSRQRAFIADALRLERDCGGVPPLDAAATATSRASAAPASAPASAPAGTTTTAAACTFFASPSGDDASGTGSQSAPFKTVARALGATRAARAPPPAATARHAGPCAVWLRAGTYYLGAPEEAGGGPVLLGTADSHLSLGAWAGEDVTLSGGRLLLGGGGPGPGSGGWEPDTSAGAAPGTLRMAVPQGAGERAPPVLPGNGGGGGGGGGGGSAAAAAAAPAAITGPYRRLFVGGAAQTWARFPNAPPGLAESALRIPIGRIATPDPPRVGYVGSDWTGEAGLVAPTTWMNPTVGAFAQGAGFAMWADREVAAPNWIDSYDLPPGVRNCSGCGKPGASTHGGMSLKYIDAVGGPFARFSPPVAHGAPRTRTVPTAPVGLRFEPASFSPRVGRWREVEHAVVHSMHWWHNVDCNGTLLNGTAPAGFVDCRSQPRSKGTWPSWPYPTWGGGDPGAGDGYWGAWAWAVERLDLAESRLFFGAGGSQTTRGALNAGPWYVEGVAAELDAPAEFHHSLNESVLRWLPNGTAAAGPTAAVVGAALPTVLAVVGDSAAAPAVDINVTGVRIAHAAPHYTGPYPTCGGGDFCAARAGAVVVTAAADVRVEGVEVDAPGGNGIAVLGWARRVAVRGCWVHDAGEVGVVVMGYQGAGAAGFDGTAPLHPHPLDTEVSGCLVHEVATKLRGGCALFQSIAARTNASGNVLFNGPRAGVNFNDDFGGGSLLGGNVVFNFVRESADHGNENSWDRVPFLTAYRTGAPSLRPAPNRNWGNLMLMSNFGSNLDHDDGSSNWDDSFNVLAGGGGFTKHAGPYQSERGNLNLLGVGGGGDACASTQAHEEYSNNTCLGSAAALNDISGCVPASGVDNSTGAAPRARGNAYWVAAKAGGAAAAYVKCGGAKLTLEQAAAVGLESGSEVRDASALSVAQIVAMAKARLASVPW